MKYELDKFGHNVVTLQEYFDKNLHRVDYSFTVVDEKMKGSEIFNGDYEDIKFERLKQGDLISKIKSENTSFNMSNAALFNLNLAGIEGINLGALLGESFIEEVSGSSEISILRNSYVNYVRDNSRLGVVIDSEVENLLDSASIYELGLFSHLRSMQGCSSVEFFKFNAEIFTMHNNSKVLNMLPGYMIRDGHKKIYELGKYIGDKKDDIVVLEPQINRIHDKASVSGKPFLKYYLFFTAAIRDGER